MTSSPQHRANALQSVARQPIEACLLSIEDVAAYLRVSPRWVYTQVRTGRLPAMLIARSWRVRQEAVDEFAESFARATA